MWDYICETVSQSYDHDQFLSDREAEKCILNDYIRFARNRKCYM